MGGGSSKERKTLDDYRSDQEMEGRVQSLDSIHRHTQNLNMKENIQLVTNEKEVQEGGSPQANQHNLKHDAPMKAEENMTEVGYQQGILGQYDWREHLGWRSEDIFGYENQESFGMESQGQESEDPRVGQSQEGKKEDSLLPMQVCNMRSRQVQRQGLPVQFQKS